MDPGASRPEDGTDAPHGPLDLTPVLASDLEAPDAARRQQRWARTHDRREIGSGLRRHAGERTETFYWEAIDVLRIGKDEIRVTVAGHLFRELLDQLERSKADYRSDRHAEMVVLDDWEDAGSATPDAILYTSVEPCPMCLSA